MEPRPVPYRIDLQPLGRRIEARPGESILEAAQAAGVALISICGGEGLCHECRVRLAAGSLSPLTTDELETLDKDELAQGYRLACQAHPLSDIRLDIPPESLTASQRLQLEGEELALTPETGITAIDLTLNPPSLADLRSDLTRLQDGLAAAGLPPARLSLPVLADLPERLRAQDFHVRLAVKRDEIIAVLPQGANIYGFAVDVGTTKLAAYLVDLQTGAAAGKAGAMNPQIAYGEDVVSRIAYANQGADHLARLQSRLVEELDGLLGGLCASAGAAREQVVDAVVVGNTAMHHLFAGLPVRSLGQAPYVAVVTAPLELPTGALGLHMAPGAAVYLPANIAGYVGADHVSMLLATGAWRGPQPGAGGKAVLALDIGTNTEISLATGERVISCSCASGPAFEGAHIHDGMRAAPGAVESVQRVGGAWRYATIDHQPAVGVCGSGILDAVAEMAADGAIDRRGSLQLSHPRVHPGEKNGVFVLVPAAETQTGREIVVTRRDVNEIQLAKAAIRAGIEVLLQVAGLTAGDLEEIIIAGAFGTYIDIGNAVRVGMFPALPLVKFHQVGNAAGAGAKRMLLSRSERALADQFLGRVEYVELTTHPGFTEEFMRAIGFGGG
ncbi:MAG TPA: ASKHA domain-containing protein [Anaerolineaceae bacterium]